MKLNTENFNRILNTCTNNFNFISTSNSNCFLNTSSNNFTTTSSGNYRNRTLPSIFKVELRKSKKEKDSEKKSKIEFYNAASTHNNLNTLNDISSFCGNEIDNSRNDFGKNHNLQSNHLDHNYTIRTKILSSLDRDYDNFFNKLEENSRKHKSVIIKDLNKKTEIERKQKKKFYENLDRNNRKVLKLLEKRKHQM
jgi:hypothetical protein